MPCGISSDLSEPPATMAYSDFTLARLRRDFGRTITQTVDLFGDIAEVPLPPSLAATLDRYGVVARNLRTEKAKSEYIIAPILMELKLQRGDRVGLFSGVDFPVDPTLGLTGRCDFLLTRSGDQLDLVAPVCVVVEAKNEDIIAGIPQALATMIAARCFNDQAGAPIDSIFGVVTTGSLWRFLKLTETETFVDASEYAIQVPGQIYAILTRMVLGE